MAAKTHLALLQEEPKGPLVVRSVPTVPPGKGQVQVRVKAASLNPIDYKQFADVYVTDKFPYIGGGDLSGIVTQVGEGVTHVKEGDRVCNVVFNFIEPMSCSAFQEYSTCDANPAVKIPDTVSFSQAATVPVTFYTALVGLCFPTLLNLRWPGDPFPSPNPTPILVWGAGSAIGRHCVQILRAANYSNIIATASPHRFDDVRSVGAKAVFNYHDADIVEQIQNYLGDEKLLHGYDPISTPASLVHWAKIISPGGTVATVTPQGQDILPFQGADIKRARTFLALILKCCDPYDSLKPEGRKFGRKCGEYLQKILEDGPYSFISYRELPGGLAGGGVQKGADMLRLNENHGDKIVISDI